MKTKAAFWSVALLATMASAAQAATTLVTPPYDYLTQHELYCTVRNIGAQGDVHVRIEARDNWGAVKSTSGEVTLTPGKAFAQPGAAKSAYCAFVVLSGSKKKVRATALLSDPFHNDNYIAAIPAE